MSDKCLQYAEYISQFLDGELEQGVAEEIRRHMQECAKCSHCVHTLQKTVELLRGYPAEPVPEDVRERLRKELRECLGKDI